MALFDSLDISAGLALADRVSPKYKAVFDNAANDRDRAALAMYFLPHRSRKDILGVTRPRMIKWYCPFAHQKDFPTGHRYCINVYTGCSHECTYCYAAGYEPDEPGCKRDFETLLGRDLSDLEAFDVPPAPVHLSNSTDPFQAIEETVGQTRFALEQIARHRRRFSSVVLLTKNPAIATRPEYLALLRELVCLPKDHPRYDEFKKRDLPGLRIEVSMAFWRDEARQVYDPGAPSIGSRIAAVRQLRAAGVPVVLRIDPLLPRDPLPDGKVMADFALPDGQPIDDLEQLVAFAAQQGVMHVVYSTLKIVRPRFKPMSDAIQKLKAVYEHLAGPEQLIFRGGSWRLPETTLREHITKPFLAICRKHGVPARFCKQNLLATP
jgi:DNA repair photolyase